MPSKPSCPRPLNRCSRRSEQASRDHLRPGSFGSGSLRRWSAVGRMARRSPDSRTDRTTAGYAARFTRPKTTIAGRGCRAVPNAASLPGRATWRGRPPWSAMFVRFARPPRQPPRHLRPRFRQGAGGRKPTPHPLSWPFAPREKGRINTMTKHRHPATQRRTNFPVGSLCASMRRPNANSSSSNERG